MRYYRMSKQIKFMTLVLLIEAKKEKALLYAVFHPMLYFSENSANLNADLEYDKIHKLIKIRYLD